MYLTIEDRFKYNLSLSYYMVKRICNYCKNKYETIKSRNIKYCSQKCYNKTKSGSGNPHWRGGKILVDGYYYIYSPSHPNKTKDKYVAEHRLVAEKKIGRYLTKQEVVHHRNGIKTDNSKDNIVICSTTGLHTKVCHPKSRDKKTGRFLK